jgi:ankyrin repeat protein
MNSDPDEVLLSLLKQRHPSMEQVEEAIARGANINAADSDGVTMLMYAVRNEAASGALVSLLLKNGADVNAMAHNGDTALLKAVFYRHLCIATLRLLIEHGSNVNATNKKMDSVLMVALWSQPAPIIEELLKHGACVKDGDKSMIAYALRLHHGVDVIRILLDYAADIHFENDQALFAAIERFVFDGFIGGSADSVMLLLENGACINAIHNRCGTVLDYVTQWMRHYQGGKRLAFSDIYLPRIAQIRDVLVKAGASHSDQLVADKVGAWLHVYAGRATGLFTDTGVLRVEMLPNISKDQVDRFTTWHRQQRDLWESAKNIQHHGDKDAWKKCNLQGLGIAHEIKQLVGPVVNVSHGSICLEGQQDCTPVVEWQFVAG